MRAALSTLLIRRGIVRKAVASASTLNAKPRRSFCINAAGEGSTPDPVPEKVLDHEEKVGMSAESGQYDVAIIGGGMVGLALACALSSAPLTKQLTVAIIDSNPALGLRTCLKKDDIPDSRVSTITPATISFLKDFGAWEYVQQQRHAFFDQMQVWDYTGLGYTRYNARDVGKDYLGCVVENKVLSNSLLLCLQDKDFEKTIYSSKLTSMTFPSKSSSARTATDATANRSTLSVSSSSKDSVEKIHGSHLVKLDLSDGKSLYAKLVVGADGAKSRVREIAGLKTTGWNYSQNAVICTVEHTVENHCAWQRFLPSGPIALLPIGDKFSNIVWTMSPEGSSSHISMNEDDFVKAVNHALDYGYGPHPRSSFIDRYMDRLPWVSGYGTLSTRESFELPPKAVSVVSKRMAFPLSLMHANDYVLRRVALIGDAAHTVHPLAGQGVNLGFGDASALAKVIAEGLSVGADIGELSSLKKYEKERKAANVTMMALLDGFQKAYSVDIGPINLLRAAAFHGAQYIAPLKKNIISYAMGKQKWPFFI